MHLEGQVRQWFEEIRNNAYPDISSKLIFKHLKFSMTGYSSPFNGNVYLNLDLINIHESPKEAVIGIIAHELAHQVSYKKRTFISEIGLIWNYWLSVKKRRAVELETDEIAVQRGFGKELLADRESEDKYYSNDKKTLEIIRNVYLGPAEIKKLIKKYSR